MKLAYPLDVEDVGQIPGKWFPFGVGIDCHKAMVWACVLQPDYRTNTQQRTRAKFGTDATDVQQSLDILAERRS
jgi:hypothetical protein